MSQSRSARRVLAAAAAVPLALTAAPLTGIAQAAVTIGVTEHALPTPRLIGPNAGFNELARGVQGFTPLYRFTVSDKTVGVTSVKLGLAGTTLNVFRDFDSNDGFTIFADVDDDATFDATCVPGPPATPGGDPTPCLSDFTTGPVSSDFAIGAASGGITPVTISGRLVADEVDEGETPDPVAKDYKAYFVVVHPTALALPNRDFTPRLFEAGVATTDGATAPAAALVSAPVTLDSLAPPMPSAGNFTVVPRAPMIQQTAPALEDGYFVGVNERNTEPGKKLAFFNNSTDPAASGLLRHPDASPVIHLAPSSGAGPLGIGDGTGINSVSTVAKNNQTSDTVYVRGLDDAGNLSSAETLSTDQSDSNPNRGNDVTAPVTTAYSVNFRKSDGTVVDSVNASNVAAVPVRVDLTGVPTGHASRYHVDATFGEVDTRVVVVDGLNQPTAAATAWTKATMTGTTTANSNHDLSDSTKFPDGARVIAQSKAYDQFGNVTPVIDSGCTQANPSVCDTLRAIPKDAAKPTILAIVPASGFDEATPTFNAGDKIKVLFSEVMDVATIDHAPGTGSGSGFEGPTCSPSPLGACVTFRLTPQDGAPTIENDTATFEEVVWGGEARPAGFDPTSGEYVEPSAGTPGTGPGFEWVDGGSAAIITLAPMNDPVARYPVLGDKVIPVATAITDRAGNELETVATIVEGGVIPLTATTRDDEVAAQPMGIATGQNHDGRLDSISVVFSNAIMASSVPAAAPNFRVTGSTGTFTPLVVNPTSDGTTLTLRIPDAQVLGSSETPLVTLIGANALTTGLLRSTGAAVPPFSLRAADGAKPTLLDAKTQDANGDGHLDSVAVRYSEQINHADMNERGYKVVGYEDIAEVGPVVVVFDPGRSANSYTPTTGTGVSQTVGLEPLTTPDTGVLPNGSYSTYHSTPEENTAPDSGLHDLAPLPNYGGWTIPRLPDGAAPVAMSAATRDVDSDGKLDAVDVTFSEALASSSSSSGTFTVDGHEVLGSSATDANVIRVRINETGEPFTGDTALRPPVRYTGGADGGLMDTAGNAARTMALTSPGLTPTDGAGPAIVTATVNFEGNRLGDDDDAYSDKMRVYFSEPVAAVAAADFLVAQADSSPTAGAQPVASGAPTAAALSADFLTADLTLDPVIYRMLDATVSFGPDAAVKDRATPTAQSNTQTAPVVSPGYPIATIRVVGPAGSRAGYSTSRRPTVIAGGNAGVTGYCLQYWRTTTPVEAAKPAPDSVDDTCNEGEAEGANFTGLPPTTLPANLIDGTYKFQLTTRDRFGNVSIPATTSIIVDATGATISALSFKNFTTGSTTSVRDNDFVYVDAIAKGAGANQFTATIDYRNLTPKPGNGSRCVGTVCTGQVLATSSTSRSFRFPFVTASGTTVYPVGTVLKPSNDSGQPFILEDGPTGVVRRRFMSAQAMATYRIPSNLVITVPPAVTNAIRSGNRKVYRDGSLVRAGSGPIYVIVEGKKYPLTAQQMTKFGYQTSNVIPVPSGDLGLVPSYSGSPFGGGGQIHPAGTYLRSSRSGAVYVLVKNSAGQLRKRRITSSAALATLVPSAQVITVSGTHASLSGLVPLDGFKRGLRDGMLVRFSPTDNKVYAVSRGGLRHINSPAALLNMGFSFKNVVVVKPSDAGITTTLLPIGTRLITYTVTVRDQAGNVTRRNGSVTALGSPLAPPAYGSNAALP